EFTERPAAHLPGITGPDRRLVLVCVTEPRQVHDRARLDDDDGRLVQGENTVNELVLAFWQIERAAITAPRDGVLLAFVSRRVAHDHHHRVRVCGCVRGVAGGYGPRSAGDLLNTLERPVRTFGIAI